MMSPGEVKEVGSIVEGFNDQGYVTEEDLATAIFLLLRLNKPLLLEGHPGVGKTEVAKALATFLQTDLIRLQCYEGLDVSSAVYEWNYQKQLLAIKIQEKSTLSEAEKEKHIFGPDFLLARPLLQSISAKAKAPVLLIDEIDRADEEFEAFLLELLSEFQISIPELGTIKAEYKPYTVLTSNRTRELGDALKRRCLYHWLDYPDPEKELRIVQKKMPGIEKELAIQIVSAVQKLRAKNLSRLPGIAETLDWTLSLLELGYKTLDNSAISNTLGCLIKSQEDIAQLKKEGFQDLLLPAESGSKS